MRCLLYAARDRHGAFSFVKRMDLVLGIGAMCHAAADALEEAFRLPPQRTRRMK